MEDKLVQRILDNPKYQQLKARRSSFGWWLTAAMMIVYYGFIMLVAFNKEFLSSKLGSGVMTIGMPIGLGVTVFVVGGAENFRTVYRLLGPGGFGARILGLVDQKESASWVGEVGGKPTDVLGTSIFVCDIDLEEEYCKSLGPPEVIRRLLSADLGFREDGIPQCVDRYRVFAHNFVNSCVGMDDTKIPYWQEAGAGLVAQADEAALTHAHRDRSQTGSRSNARASVR